MHLELVNCFQQLFHHCYHIKLYMLGVDVDKRYDDDRYAFEMSCIIGCVSGWRIFCDL